MNKDPVKQLIQWLEGKKTYIIAVVMVVYNVVIIGWAQKNWSQAWEGIFGGSGLATVRAAISKVPGAV